MIIRELIKNELRVNNEWKSNKSRSFCARRLPRIRDGSLIMNSIMSEMNYYICVQHFAYDIFAHRSGSLSLAKTQMWTKSSPIWYNICVIRYLYGFVWSSCFIFTNRETSDLKMAFVYLCQWFWSIFFCCDLLLT